MRIWLLVGFVLLAGCQTPMQVGSQCVVEPGHLDQETSFTWRSDQVIDVVDTTGYVGPLVVSALEQAVVNELQSKGYALEPRSSADPDDQWSNVEVELTLNTRRELMAFETSGSVCADTDCWERIDPGSATRMDIRTVGFLAADVYYLGEPVWRGWVETTLFPKDRDRFGEVIARAVPKLFATFPP